MKQWIIDRYNKGQNKYILTGYRGMSDGLVRIEYIQPVKEITYTHLYDFLFNPKWGFAKAFWGIYVLGKTYKYHLQQMAISDDPLKYLKQFKEQ